MLNLYADLTDFKQRFSLPSTLDSGDQAELLRILEAASRAVDNAADREFFTSTATRYFDGTGQRDLWLPASRYGDLLSVTTLKVDEDGDGVYELTLTANTDYWLWPDNFTPKNRIDINPESSNIGTFPLGRRRVEIAGSWGYTNATEAVASATAEALDETETGVDVVDGTAYAIGQTILVDSEQMYISGISTNTLTVTRGVNGTTAATHLTAAAVTRFVYEPEVVEATLIQAGRYWKRRETAYANVIQNPLTGAMEMFKGIDPDINAIVSNYTRIAF